MRKPIIAGNWKMFKTVSEATAFFAEVKGKAEVDGVESCHLRTIHDASSACRSS